jgi:hypothetical protein
MQIQWRLLVAPKGNDFGTFPGEFVSALPQTKIPASDLAGLLIKRPAHPPASSLTQPAKSADHERKLAYPGDDDSCCGTRQPPESAGGKERQEEADHGS